MTRIIIPALAAIFILALTGCDPSNQPPPPSPFRCGIGPDGKLVCK